MSRNYVFSLALAVGIMCCPLAQADQPSLDKLEQSAQEAYDQGKFRKAEISWGKAVRTLEDNGQKDSFFETCLKRLGQTYKKLERSVEAYQTLMRAWEICNAAGIQDSELAQELSDLSTTYRPIDVSELGAGTATALKKANVTSVCIIKTSTGNKLQIDLPDHYENQFDNDSVDGISLEKQVTVDLDEDSNGIVTLTNIKGFKIHAKEKNMWVNLLQTVIKPADAQGEHPAEVTAGKMGVTKTVSASLPANGFEPLGGVLKQARAMMTPLLVKFNFPGASQQANTVTTGPGTNAGGTVPGAATVSTSTSTAASSPMIHDAASSISPVTAGTTTTMSTSISGTSTTTSASSLTAHDALMTMPRAATMATTPSTTTPGTTTTSTTTPSTTTPGTTIPSTTTPSTTTTSATEPAAMNTTAAKTIDEPPASLPSGIGSLTP
jgi:hypothetical protein